MSRDARDLKVGIDVGGTNTDAAVLDAQDAVIAWSKRPTSGDIVGGVRAALVAVLDSLGDDAARVGRVMLGTTHATNAILERRGLGRVAVVRLGAPATTAVPPITTWPADLAETVVHDTLVTGGGSFADGTRISALDPEAVRAFLGSAAGRIDAVAVTGVFSPAVTDDELSVAELVRAELGPDLPVSMSHEIGSLGLLERENATVLNAALYGAAGQVTAALDKVLAEHHLDVAAYFAQNDGTLMALDYAGRYPVLTIGSGPANSIRGAAFLSGVDDALVADVGGTSTDLGMLVRGFPRESALAVDIGGVRTNFRMPDILSIAIGGGTTVEGTADDPRVGPGSVGYRMSEHSLVFGGGTATLTDAAVLAGRATVGSRGVDALPQDVRGLLAAATAHADAQLAGAVERMLPGSRPRPLVAVGGGSFLVPDELPGVSEVLRPERGDVANAIGAAVALASGRWECLVPPGTDRAEALAAAKDQALQRAVQAGAAPGSVEVVEVTETPLTYLREPSTRLNVTAAGPLGWL